jgi:ArsR family transcriptional regulator
VPDVSGLAVTGRHSIRPEVRDGDAEPGIHPVLSRIRGRVHEQAPSPEVPDFWLAGNENRFRILTQLVDEGSHSVKALREALEMESNTLHYHLDALVDVGLVENRKRNEPTSSGLHSYYRATSVGEGILEHGVRELMREEWDLLDAYGD